MKATTDRYWQMLVSAANDCADQYPKDSHQRYLMVALHYGATMMDAYRQTGYRNADIERTEVQIADLADLTHFLLQELDAGSVSAN